MVCGVCRRVGAQGGRIYMARDPDPGGAVGLDREDRGPSSDPEVGSCSLRGGTFGTGSEDRRVSGSRVGDDEGFGDGTRGRSRDTRRGSHQSLSESGGDVGPSSRTDSAVGKRGVGGRGGVTGRSGSRTACILPVYTAGHRGTDSGPTSVGSPKRDKDMVDTTRKGPVVPGDRGVPTTGETTEGTDSEPAGSRGPGVATRREPSGVGYTCPLASEGRPVCGVEEGVCGRGFQDVFAYRHTGNRDLSGSTGPSMDSGPAGGCDWEDFVLGEPGPPTVGSHHSRVVDSVPPAAPGGVPVSSGPPETRTSSTGTRSDPDSSPGTWTRTTGSSRSAGVSSPTPRSPPTHTEKTRRLTG